MTKIISGGNELLDAAALLSKELGVESAKVVADLGVGGAAYFTMAAAKIVGDRGQVYAVDILKNVLSSVESKARLHRFYNIKTVWSNIEIFGATNMPEAFVDYVLLVNTLFQSKKHEDMIKEAVRLMKIGGKLLIVDWSHEGGPFGPADKDKIDPEEVRGIARNNGLAELKFFKAGQYHFGLIFTKV